jgi:hypothetical protein
MKKDSTLLATAALTASPLMVAPRLDCHIIRRGIWCRANGT